MLPHQWLLSAVEAKLFQLLWGGRFEYFGKGARVYRPEGVEGASGITIGDGAVIGARSYLSANSRSPESQAQLIIGDGARIGRFNHIYAAKRIKIGARVLTANNVYIADNTHRYEDPDLAVLDQPVRQLDSVEIGNGSWIGHGACIIGASIGRNCVIGAGAIVRESIPDFSVAVGCPARVVRCFDKGTGRWEKC